MIKLKTAILILIFFLGFIVRLYRFEEPVADWHSFRQSDTAAVSQIFVNEGYNLLYPKYFDISNVQSGLDNPKGYRFVEFPIYNFFQALLFKSIGLISLDQWGRLLNITLSLVTGLVIYLLVRKYFNKIAAVASLAAFLFLPFSIFYSRVILPDILMTTSIMLGIYFFDRHLEKHKVKGQKIVFYLLSLLFVSLAFLVKPFALFFTLPLIFLAYKKFGLRMFFKWHLYVFAFICILPLYFWRNWISQFPEGIPASAWLFNGNDIRFRPAFFRWIFFERVTKLILGYAGVIFLISSFSVLYKNKNILFFASFAVSSLIYLFVMATGNVQHDYYQILIMPTISMFFGIGVYGLYKFISSKLNNIIACAVIIVFSVGTFYFSWYQVKDYFNINDRGMVAAGTRANEILPEDAVIIAPYDGSTTLLNLSQRRGWPIFQESIEVLILKGATYMVIANPTVNDFAGFGTQYEVVDSSDKYLILKLK